MRFMEHFSYGTKKSNKILLVSSFVFVSFFCISVFSYFECKKSILLELSLCSQQVAEQIKNTFSSVEHHLIYMGKTIASAQTINDQALNANTLQEHYKLLQSHYDLLGTTFEWFTPNFHLINSQNESANSNETLINENIIRCIKNPWKLLLISLQLTYNDLRELHGGMAIVNPNGEYCGTIWVKFNTASFAHNLSKLIVNPHIMFFVVDNNNQIILKSNDINHINNVYGLSKILAEEPRFLKSFSPIEKSFSFEKVRYLYYQKVSEMPYTVVLGMNQLFLVKEYLLATLSRLALLAIAILVNFIIVYKVKQQNHSQLIRSHEAFKNHILNIKNHWNEALIVINFYCQLLKKSKDTNTVTFDDYEIINQIQSLSNNLWQNRTYKNFSNQSIIDIIQNSIDIKTPDALAKNIKIETLSSKSIPPIYVDEHAITQAIAEILEFCIGYSPCNEKILVESKHMVGSFSVNITHYGTNVDLDNLDRITKKLKNQRVSLGIELNGCCFSNIKKIVSAHRGELSTSSQEYGRNTFIIEIPYDHFKEQNLPLEDATKSANVIQFKKV